MKTTLTPLKTFNLTINGVVFENMKQTGELNGITEFSNGTTKATLLHTGSNFGGFFDSLFSDGVQSDWVPLRGTPDIQKAVALSQEKVVTKNLTIVKSLDRNELNIVYETSEGMLSKFHELYEVAFCEKNSLTLSANQ